MSLEDLIRDLHSPEEKIRAFAAEDIAYDAYIEGIGALVERLQVEPSRFVREAMVNSLKSMQGPELINQVIPMLKSDDAFIRNGCIEILARQGEDAIVALRPLLRNPDKDIRKFVLDTLCQIGMNAAADLIAESLADPDLNNVIAAVEYLGKMEAYGHIEQINKLFLNTRNTLLRCTCLETMALIGDEESIKCVNKMYPHYQSISFLEQYSFLKFVARRGSQIHMALIISLLEDQNLVMHKEIINAIEGILHRSQLEYLPQELLLALEKYLEKPIKDINKYEILVLLGDYKNEEILAVLLRYLNPENKLLCLGAVEALGLYGNQAAQSALITLKEQLNDDELLENIERSLGKLV